jgi:hypothetical protein
MARASSDVEHCPRWPRQVVGHLVVEHVGADLSLHRRVLLVHELVAES